MLYSVLLMPYVIRLNFMLMKLRIKYLDYRYISDIFSEYYQLENKGKESLKYKDAVVLFVLARLFVKV